jgi:hypothetical protein
MGRERGSGDDKAITTRVGDGRTIKWRTSFWFTSSWIGVCEITGHSNTVDAGFVSAFWVSGSCPVADILYQDEY